MPRLRKLRRKQKYGYHINRRRLDKKMKKLPKINCDAVREAWDDKKSVAKNLSAMGLMVDPNAHKGLKIPSVKDQMNSFPNQDEVDSDEVPEKGHVANTLEEQAKEQFQKNKEVVQSLPPEMYKKLCKFIDKYGEDYEAMAKDHTNYYQETPKQLKKQIEKLKKIPQQWIPYLRSRELIKD